MLAGRPRMSLSLLQLHPRECEEKEVGRGDLLCLIHAMEHLEDPNTFRCMRPGGGALAEEKQQAKYWEVGIVKPSLSPI